MSLTVAHEAETSIRAPAETAVHVAAHRSVHIRVLSLLAILAMAQGIFYALFVPPWQVPDETGHFEYAWTMAQLGRIPHPSDVSPAFERALIDTLYQYQFGESIMRSLPVEKPERLDDLPRSIHATRTRTLLFDRFSLSYLPPAFAIALLPHADLITQLYAARFTSIILTILIAALIYQIGLLTLDGDWRLSGAVTALALLIPQHAFINAAVTDGTLAELCATLAIYGWVRLFAKGMAVSSVIWIITGTVLGLFAKATTAFLLPVGVLLAVWWAMTRLRLHNMRSGRWLLFVIPVVLLLLFLVSPLRSRLMEMLTTTGTSLYWRDDQGISFAQGLQLTYHSAWAYFGWLILPVSQGWYTVADLLFVGAVLGLIIGRWRPVPELNLVLVVTFVMAVVVFSYGGLLTQSNYWIQGRYLFPAIAPFIILLFSGLLQPFSARWRPIVALGCIVAFMLFNLWCIIGYIIPFYYT